MTRWNSGDVAADIMDFTGGMWNDEIPRTKKLPFVVFAITDGGSIEHRTSGDGTNRLRVQMTQVQFDIYERGRSAAGTLANKLMTVFDNHEMEVSGTDLSVLGCRYFNDYCLKDSETVYRWVVVFEIRYWINEPADS